MVMKTTHKKEIKKKGLKKGEKERKKGERDERKERRSEIKEKGER